MKKMNPCDKCVAKKFIHDSHACNSSYFRNTFEELKREAAKYLLINYEPKFSCGVQELLMTEKGNEMSKKKNPRKIPATLEDVNKAQRLGQAQGVDLAFTIFFTALLDKGIVTRENIPEVWAATCYVADSIKEGYVNIYEQQKMLEEEYSIRFSKLRV